MASPIYTVDAPTTGLIASVQRRAHIPLANVTFTPGDICAFGDDVTRTAIVRQILSVREAYYLSSLSYSLNNTGVFPIPYRAIGQRVNKIQMVVGTIVYPMVRIEPGDLTNTINPPTNTYAFYLEGNNIVTIPILNSGNLVVWYYPRPSNLAVSTQCMQVASVNLVANQVTVVSLGSGGYSNGSIIDFTQSQAPFSLLYYDIPIVNITGTTITFGSGNIPPNLAVGDWICYAQTTCVPQMPMDFQALLAQRVTVEVLQSQGYTGKLPAAQAKLQEMEADLLKIINPRDEGNSKKIMPNRGLVRPGPNRQGGYWYVAP